jgi:putative addiction module component (TIGR02574 family)
MGVGCCVSLKSFQEAKMGASAKSLGIDKLDVSDRLALVEEIWASIVADAGAFPLTSEQRDELDRRVADDDDYPDDVIPWKDVKSSVRSRLGR